MTLKYSGSDSNLRSIKKINCKEFYSEYIYWKKKRKKTNVWLNAQSRWCDSIHCDWNAVNDDAMMLMMKWTTLSIETACFITVWLINTWAQFISIIQHNMIAFNFFIFTQLEHMNELCNYFWPFLWVSMFMNRFYGSEI